MRDGFMEDAAAHAANAITDGIRRGVGRRTNVCRGAFPNDLGNYRGKRFPKPDPKPLTAQDRFFLLCAAYETFRQRKRIERLSRRAAKMGRTAVAAA